MPVLSNVKHERFAVLVASGKSKADAYREVFPRSLGWMDKSVHEQASRVAARPKVAARIDELVQTKTDATILSRDEALRYLTRVVRTPVAEVDADSDLVQEVEDRGDGRKVKMVGKLEAVREIARTLGYYAPAKVEGTIRYIPDSDVMAKLGG